MYLKVCNKNNELQKHWKNWMSALTIGNEIIFLKAVYDVQRMQHTSNIL